MTFGANKKEVTLHLLNAIYERQKFAFDNDENYDIYMGHEHADNVLLAHIADPEISEAFSKIERRYS